MARASGLVSVVLLTVLVGCTGERPTVAAEAPAVSVAAWSDDFCASYRAWADELDDAGTAAADALDPKDRSGARAALVDLFGASAKATTRLVVALRDAPAPDVAGGVEFVEELTGRFAAYGRALRDGQAAAEALDVDDVASFLTGAVALRDDYRASRATVQEAFTTLGGSEAGGTLAVAVDADCTS